MGYFNLNFNEWNTAIRPKRKLNGLVNANVVTKSLTQTIDESTHEGHNRGTLIDQVGNNCPRKMVESGTIFNGDSYHNIIWETRVWISRKEWMRGGYRKTIVKQHSIKN